MLSGVEQKRAELEALSSECRLAERKLDDTKRSARELEISAEKVRDGVKQLENDKVPLILLKMQVVLCRLLGADT